MPIPMRSSDSSMSRACCFVRATMVPFHVYSSREGGRTGNSFATKETSRKSIVESSEASDRKKLIAGNRNQVVAHPCSLFVTADDKGLSNRHSGNCRIPRKRVDLEHEESAEIAAFVYPLCFLRKSAEVIDNTSVNIFASTKSAESYQNKGDNRNPNGNLDADVGWAFMTNLDCYTISVTIVK